MTCTFSWADFILLFGALGYLIVCVMTITMGRCQRDTLIEMNRRMFRLEHLCGLTHKFTSDDLDFVIRVLKRAHEEERNRISSIASKEATSPCAKTPARKTRTDRKTVGKTEAKAKRMSKTESLTRSHFSTTQTGREISK